MQAQAVARGIRMSPRKMRLVVDLIRGRRVSDAYSILQFSKKHAAKAVAKALRSAVANAQQKSDNQGSFLDVDELVVREVFVNEAPMLKRFKAAAMGRAAPIRKRSSHLTIVVDRPQAVSVADAAATKPAPIRGAAA